MNDLVTIELKELRFFAFHGLYSEEKKTGNEFEMNLSVAFHPGSGTITGIADTVNYAALYELMRSEMQQPRELLETVVMELAEKIHAGWPSVKKIDIGLTKLQAPIEKFTGKVGVRYTKEY
jgi:dihydroneopterin aldolase